MTDDESPGTGETDDDSMLYPNAGDDGDDATIDHTPSLSRRRLLAGSATAGAVATAGCLGSGDGAETDRPTVFVFNTGDGTVSVVDAETDEVVATPTLGLSSSFPSNQFSPTLSAATDDPLWLNVGRGVRALSVGSFSGRARVETGSGANWLERTPDGAHLLVSAREPAHTQYRIGADPAAEDFGTVTARIDRADEGGRGVNDGPGPCDVTIHPDGEYAYVPDLYGDTLTVLSVDPFEVVRQVSVDPVGDGPAAPWMATASWDGTSLLVEHNEGQGSESVWDVSDPTAPEQVARLTADDGLGKRPLTSEIGPDSETGYVFTPGSNDVTVLDIEAGTVTDRLDLGGSAFTGTWGPDRETLYVPVQTEDEVAVLDHDSGAVTTTVPVGAKPYGATAATVRPDTSAVSTVGATVAQLGGAVPRETTYCIGNCACGHEL